MKTSTSIFALGFIASIGFAKPIAEEIPGVSGLELESRQTASGCNYYAAPRCCMPSVCQCGDGRIYQINQDAMNGGRHGCDPPWGFIADHPSGFPGYCC